MCKKIHYECCDFVKFKFVKLRPGVSDGSTKDHKGNGSREVYYMEILEEVYCMPQGAPGGGQGRVQTETRDLGHRLY